VIDGLYGIPEKGTQSEDPEEVEEIHGHVAPARGIPSQCSLFRFFSRLHVTQHALEPALLGQRRIREGEEGDEDQRRAHEDPEDGGHPFQHELEQSAEA
jgi:hypothetical protein